MTNFLYFCNWLLIFKWIKCLLLLLNLFHLSPLFELLLSMLNLNSFRSIERLHLRKGRSSHILLLCIVVIRPGFKFMSLSSIKMNLKYDYTCLNEPLIEHNWIQVRFKYDEFYGFISDGFSCYTRCLTGT